MSLAWVSVAALVLAVALSCTTAVNVGVVSLVLAWIVGVYLGGMSVNAVLEGFPTPLLVTLVGVTLLFSSSEANGTLARVTGRAVRLCRGHAGVLPIMFFVLGLVISTIGSWRHTDGGAAGAARDGRGGQRGHLAAADDRHGGQRRARRNAVALRAQRGSSPTACMGRIGLGGRRVADVCLQRARARIVGFGGFALLGGWKLFRRRERDAWRPRSRRRVPWRRAHWLTLAGILILIVTVAGFDMHVGMMALAIARHLTLLGAVDEKQAIQGHAVGRDPDGDRRDGARVDAREDRGPRPVHDSHGERRPARRPSSRWSPSARVSSRSTAARRAWCCRRSCRSCRGSRSASGGSRRCRSRGR